jgi:hypothetical protein
MLTFKINFSGEHKIAVRAADSTGRVGYMYPVGKNGWSLVVRNFSVNPSGEYVDCPKKDLQDLGYAVNIVNVDSQLGDFCELEYHVPAIGHGVMSSTDISQVWAFKGDKRIISIISKKLLG